MMGLTRRQSDALRFIAGFQQSKGFCPSMAEISNGLGLRSKHPVSRLVRALEERGAIARLLNRNRAIEVLVDVPIPRGPDLEPLYFVHVGGRAV